MRGMYAWAHRSALSLVPRRAEKVWSVDETTLRDDYVSAITLIHEFIWGLWERSRYFRHLCSALRKLDNRVVLLLGFLYLRSVERKRLRDHWQHRFGETGAQTSPNYANYGKLVGHFSGEKQFCKAGYC